MPYYPNDDVICWIKTFITEAYEGALDEDQKKDIRKNWNEFVQTKGGRYEVDKYKWAWNMIAVPFGIEDMCNFPKEFATALKNSWIAAGESADDDPKDTSFSEELQELFDQDATGRSCWNCDDWFEIDEVEDEEDEDTCQGCRTIPNLLDEDGNY